MDPILSDHELAARAAPIRIVHTALRWLWALPCTLLGMALALPLLVFGGKAQRVGRTFEVAWRPAGRARLPFTALTLGHVIVGVSAVELERLRAHEQAHVRQFERWGPLLLVAYPLASVVAWWRGEGAYWGNRFEREARAAEAALVSARPKTPSPTR